MSYDKNKLTILIPTKNEGEGIEGVIKSVKPYAKEIIIVDGYSNDGTAEIGKRRGCRFFLDHGLGKGDGVRLGLAKAKGEIVIIFDGDGSAEIKDIPNLVEPILEDKADLVIGSRRTGGTFDTNPVLTGIVRTAGADLLAALVNHRFGTKLTDVLYSFRAIRKSIVPKLDLRANDFTIEQEMIIKALKKNFRVLEIPSREKARQWGSSKLKTITGLKMLFHLLRECFL
ncbi:glycosyltransferase family 2 protein [Candidatus Gottesmanbacteria bacterium]|nr:glycosyltransferase family 2 protein [Candidatus Gottesmanbacteria bacterium]MBI5465587.1 glycosyltransferase family 2 protein [Candidatus Gottesmanbacteria bacterium]